MLEQNLFYRVLAAMDTDARGELALGDHLDVMKTILETVEFRAKLLTDSGVIDRCVKHGEGLKHQLAELRKKEQASPKWEVVKSDGKREGRRLQKVKKEARLEIIV